MICPRYTPGPFKIPSEHHWRSDNTCSYCGSMHPDVFMDYVRAGVELGPTDKNYKVYVHPDSKHPVPGAGKFYWYHLSETQMREFISLLNEAKVNLGYPGYFYTKPYFIAYD